jgi:hypothetical protein
MTTPAQLITASGAVYTGRILSGEVVRRFKGGRKIRMVFELTDKQQKH